MLKRRRSFHTPFCCAVLAGMILGGMVLFAASPKGTSGAGSPEQLLKANHPRKALAMTNRMLIKKPNDLDTLCYKVQALQALGLYMKAAGVALPLAGKHPDHPEFRFLAGKSAYEMGMVPQAVHVWSALLENKEWAKIACRWSVIALNAWGKEAKAKELLEKTLSRMHPPPVGLLQLKLNLTDNGPEGLKLSKTLAALDPADKGYYEAIGKLYEAAGSETLFDQAKTMKYPVIIPVKEKSESRVLPSLAWGGEGAGSTELVSSTDIVVPVSVNGSKKEYMLLDSGSNNVLLSPFLVKKLGLKAIASAQYSGLGFRGAQKSDWVFIKQLSIGSYTVKNIPAMVINKHSGYYKQIDGIIPLSLLKYSAMVLDRRHGKLLLYPSGTPPEEVMGKGTFRLNNLWPDDCPMVQVTIQGRKGRFCLVDTGAWATILSSERKKTMGVSINSGQYGAQMGIGMSGAFSTGVASDVKMVIGRALLNMRTVNVMPIGTSGTLDCYGILGRRDALDLFKLFFDYRANVIAFAPYDK